MRAYLVQHGKAKSGPEDANGSLNDEGRQEVERMSHFLSGMRLTVSLIQHSGKRRAEETAHLFAETIRCSTSPCPVEGMDPTDDPVEAFNFLKAYTDDILVVGHLPHLERLTSLLLTGDSNHRPVQFRNGGVVCLEKSTDGRWTLVWAVTPELLRTPTVLAA